MAVNQSSEGVEAVDFSVTTFGKYLTTTLNAAVEAVNPDSVSGLAAIRRQVAVSIRFIDGVPVDLDVSAVTVYRRELEEGADPEPGPDADHETPGPGNSDSSPQSAQLMT